MGWILLPTPYTYIHTYILNTYNKHLVTWGLNCVRRDYCYLWFLLEISFYCHEQQSLYPQRSSAPLATTVTFCLYSGVPYTITRAWALAVIHLGAAWEFQAISSNSREDM
jgi:hypothetical protein